MQQTDRPPVVVSRRGPPRRRRDVAADATELERALSAHEEATRQQIERGVRAMYRAAVRLMRQMTAEAWGAAGPGADDRLRERIVETLARDDALRAVLGQVEERHQAVGLRLDRIEGAIRHLIRANREALERPSGPEGSEMSARLEALAASVASAAEDRRRLEGLSKSISEAARAAEADRSAIAAEVRAAVADAAPPRDRVEAAAARGAERVVRAELARLHAAVGRLASLATASPGPAGAGPPRTPGSPGAEERLRALGRRLAWTSARLAAVGGAGNGEAAS
ncbi:MAG TPA: hypothetical protein VHL78_01970 [Actinomycetota bacterium]|nr:hypothetical protein [Actinomycetota bacterium]